MSKQKKRATFETTPLRTVDIDVPAWGGLVTLRELYADETYQLVLEGSDVADSGGNILLDSVGRVQFALRVLRLTITDEDGSRPLDSRDGAQTINRLLQDHPDQFAELLNASIDLLGIGKVEQKKKRAPRNGRLMLPAK